MEILMRYLTIDWGVDHVQLQQVQRENIVRILKVLRECNNRTLVRLRNGFASASFSNILLRSKTLLVRLNDSHAKQWLALKLKLPVLKYWKIVTFILVIVLYYLLQSDTVTTTSTMLRALLSNVWAEGVLLLANLEKRLWGENDQPYLLPQNDRNNGLAPKLFYWDFLAGKPCLHHRQTHVQSCSCSQLWTYTDS